MDAYNRAKSSYANDLFKEQGFYMYPNSKVWYADRKNFTITYKEDTTPGGRTIVFDSKKKKYVDFIGFKDEDKEAFVEMSFILMETLGWYDE